jgi:hypothetical protein
MDGVTTAATKELKRVIKFVLDTCNYGLKIEPMIINSSDDDWDIVIYTDSDDYGGDKESRISVTGYIIYLLGVQICLKSKSQISITLSSSKAEFVSL